MYRKQTPTLLILPQQSTKPINKINPTKPINKTNKTQTHKTSKQRINLNTQPHSPNKRLTTNMNSITTLLQQTQTATFQNTTNTNKHPHQTTNIKHPNKNHKTTAIIYAKHQQSQQNQSIHPAVNTQIA